MDANTALWRGVLAECRRNCRQLWTVQYLHPTPRCDTIERFSKKNRFLISFTTVSNGLVYGMGGNLFAQLGAGDTASRCSFCNVFSSFWIESCRFTCNLIGGALSSQSVLALSAGNYHSLALSAVGTVLSWGYNTYFPCFFFF